jgi:monoamine oxidase
MELVYSEMTAAFDKLSREAASVRNPYKPWLTKDAARLDHTPLSSWISGLRCSRLTKLAIEEQFSKDGGAPTDRQSFAQI